MNTIKQMMFAMVIGCFSNLALADVDCATDTCVPAQGLVESVGLDNGGALHAFSSSLPVATPTNPYIFIKLTGEGIGTAFTNCGLGDDAAMGLLTYNSILSGSIVVDARKAMYATALTARTSGQLLSLVIKDDSSCEIAFAMIAIP